MAKKKTKLNQRKKNISDDVKKEVQKIIDKYNNTIYRNCEVSYIAKYKNNFLYLNRKELSGDISPIARLTYTGKMTKWKFALYKWSIKNYATNESSFEGSEHINGTILGALKAGNVAYPSGY